MIKFKLFLDDYSSNERDIDELQRIAAETIVNGQRTNEQYYNSKHKAATMYKVDDYIMIRNIGTTPGVSKKLIPKFKGLFIVKEVLNYDRYIVKDIDGLQLTQRPFEGTVGPDQIKHWIRVD